MVVGGMATAAMEEAEDSPQSHEGRKTRIYNNSG
jgi:hypothetical protein